MCVYLIISEVIIQCVLKFAKGLFLLLLLPFLSFLEGTNWIEVNTPCHTMILQNV